MAMDGRGPTGYGTDLVSINSRAERSGAQIEPSQATNIGNARVPGPDPLKALLTPTPLPPHPLLTSLPTPSFH